MVQYMKTRREAETPVEYTDELANAACVEKILLCPGTSPGMKRYSKVRGLRGLAMYVKKSH